MMKLIVTFHIFANVPKERRGGGVTVNFISFVFQNFMCSVIRVVQPAVNVIATSY